MDTIANWWTGAFIVNTVINILKPLMPDDTKKFMPIVAILLWLGYAFLTVDGTLEIKLVSWIGIGSTSIAGHESGKVFQTTESETEEMVSIHDTTSLQHNG